MNLAEVSDEELAAEVRRRRACVKVTIRLPVELRDKLNERVAVDGISQNDWLVQLIGESL